MLEPLGHGKPNLGAKTELVLQEFKMDKYDMPNLP